jgi:predicted metal-dependent RNase
LFQVITPQERDAVLQQGGAVILASSGMLTGGASLQYLYMMAENHNNALVFVGWQSEGSLGRKIQNGIRQLPMPAGNGKTRTLNINMQVETIEGFSGHSDRNQLLNYIRCLKPKPKRILVDHGDKQKSVEFARFVSNKFRINCTAPRDLDSLRLL